MKNSKITIDEIWIRLNKYAGDKFETKTGKPFTYEISGDIFRTNRTDYNISKGEFNKALAFVPCVGPGVINHIVRGPAYVWAILHDKRIRKQN